MNIDKTLNIIKKFIPKKIFKTAQPAYHFLLSFFSAFIFKFSSNKLIVIGVTGTTGKTTVVYMIAQILKQAGFKVGYTSTAMFSNGDKEWLNDKKMTMLGRLFTQKMLSKMVQNKCQFAIVETTSEGIRQFRHRFINYDILVFTGLYPEHIESHGSFEAYKQAKGELFRHLKRCKTKYADDKKYIIEGKSPIKKIELERIKKTAIINKDDEHANYFFDFWAEQKITYSKNKADLSYKIIDTTAKGIKFTVGDKDVNMNILGDFNVSNAMAGYAVAKAIGLDHEKIKKGLEKIKGIPGRLENIQAGQDFGVIVDYAFEPNAVTKLYQTIDKIKHNKIIHVLGSTGGGRDVARRPKLGEIAGKKADFVIITNEDPYDEDPQIIIEQVFFGAEKAGKKKDKDLFKILDRREAIKKALSLAKKDDIVLITGKGSEQAICIANGDKIKWDDREVVREELKNIL